MPYVNHLRLTASGVFQGGVGAAYEAWSFRLNLSDPLAGVTSNFSQASADSHAAAVRNLILSAGAGCNDHVKLTEVKLAQINSLGKYRSEPLRAAFTPTRGGNNAPAHPLQVALAVSLATETRGASGRGRFYLPGSIFAVDKDSGLISAGDQAAAKSAVIAFLNLINDPAGVQDPPVSKVTVASVKGFNSDVTGVRVGRALDTIRSRRTSLSELYGAVAPL